MGVDVGGGSYTNADSHRLVIYTVSDLGHKRARSVITDRDPACDVRSVLIVHLCGVSFAYRALIYL